MTRPVGKPARIGPSHSRSGLLPCCYTHPAGNGERPRWDAAHEPRVGRRARAPALPWHDPWSMTTISDRYDRDAEKYGHYWAPVLDGAARRLLDRVEPYVKGLRHDPRIVDIGTGHGVLAHEARQRWPNALVIGTDASSGMLAVARNQHGGADATEQSAETLRWLHAPADDLGLPA